MHQDSNRYAVCYIDKFADLKKSQATTNAIGLQFKLSSKHRLALSSGKPIIIKQSASIEYANRLQEVISTLGGCCWIQQLDSAGQFRERRQGSRRLLADRRDLPRTNIEPDRRSPKDRRQAYQH